MAKLTGPILTTIPCLLQWSSPATIERFVGAIIVYAIKTPIFRSFTHVLVEVTKVKPSFTDSNAPTTPVFVPRTLCIETSGEHLVPATVCSAVAFSMRGVIARALRIPFPGGTNLLASRLPA